MSKYPHIARAVAEIPWAIRPSVLAVIIEIVQRRADGVRLSEEEIAERIGAGPRPKPGARAGDVAVIPIYGVLAPRAQMFAQTSSAGTGVDELRAMFRTAMADPEVGSILFDVDSPGGQVDGIPEMAGEIRAARGQKPMLALANSDAASAAYWLATSADELWVTPSGQVGSVGVFSAHEDLSAQAEMEGVKTTLVSAGKYKVEGNPFEPLGEEARTELQSKVDEYYGMFVSDLARNRGTDMATVRKDYGEGRMLTAKRAVSAGMADRVATFDQALDRARRLAIAKPRTDAALSLNEGLGAGPFAEHGELVAATLSGFLQRAQSRRDFRAIEDRDLSAGDRLRIGELRFNLVELVGQLDTLLSSEPSADALTVEAAFAEIESHLTQVERTPPHEGI